MTAMFGFKKESPISTDEEKINHLLTHNVEEIFIKDDLKKKLKSGKKLRIKLGFDPTGSNIHVGRAITLWKLKEFQDLGHKIVFLVGNFTAQIGDASDKLEKRPMLSKEKVAENLEDYLNQVGKILNTKEIEVVYNASWLEKLTFKEIVELAESFSVNQMLARRNFKERFDKGNEISLREFLYPLMQGYDSVLIKSDVEIGGFDQLFNLKAGRVIQKHFNQSPQDVLTTKMLLGIDGRKMSTSWGNVINIVDLPDDMYGKVLSLHDNLIEEYLRTTTHLKNNEIEEILKLHPKEAKDKLARELITIYYSEEDANVAASNFKKAFVQNGIPDNVEKISVNLGTQLVDILVDNNIVSSRSEFKRLIQEGAIKDLEAGIIRDIKTEINKNISLKIGKRRFVKLEIK